MRASSSLSLLLALRRSSRAVADASRPSRALLIASDVASASSSWAPADSPTSKASKAMLTSMASRLKCQKLSPSLCSSSSSLPSLSRSLFAPSLARTVTSTTAPVSSSSSDAALAEPDSSSSSSPSPSPPSAASPPSISEENNNTSNNNGGDGDDSKVGERARAIFDAAWSRLERRHGDRLRAPREQIYLMGAPGSGKGTNTVFILESRGLTRAVTMSSLLQSNPRIAAAMAAGELVPDELVADALLETVFDPDADPAGVLVDGFPRTALQVDLLKLLHDKVEEKHEFYQAQAAASAASAAAAAASSSSSSTSSSPTPSSTFLDPDSAEARWPRPSFKVVVLYVDQAESVRRQMARARLAATHNARVLDAGAGQLVDVRATDVDEALCRRRYAVFKAHYATVLRLRRWFVFSLIDSGGSLDDTRRHILRELRYQSSLDLDAETWSAIRHLPLASELTRAARQRLVSSLDGHRRRHGDVFARVVDLISSEVVPLLRSSALAGFAEYTTQEPVFSSELAQQMLIDVLTDRGFGVAHAEIEKVVPVKVDLTTGHIAVSREKKQRFRITFERGSVRNAVGGGAAEAVVAPAPTAAAAAAAGAGAGAGGGGGGGAASAREREPLPERYDQPPPSSSSAVPSVPLSPFDTGVGGGVGGGALGSTTVVPRHLDHSQSLEDAEARWRRRVAAAGGGGGGGSGGGGGGGSGGSGRGASDDLYSRFSPERRPERHPDDEDVERVAKAAAAAATAAASSNRSSSSSN